MKKILLSLALIAFVGGTTLSAQTATNDKEKTTKSDKKTDKSKTGSCCKKTEQASCCKSGESNNMNCAKKEEAK